jgi:hypothetical protein
MTEAEFHRDYLEAVKERRVWQKQYPEYERLANNDLPDDLDENDPEVSSGDLAAALFKLPKRVVPDDLSGSPRALDRSDKWINEFAKIDWEKNVIPNANTQAPFAKKWKVATRKAGIYGGVPLITITNEKNGEVYSDFFVGYPGDFTLEPGKVSDLDSDVIYGDFYFTDIQLDDLIAEYKAEEKEAKEDGRESFNTWNLKVLKELRDHKDEDERDTLDSPDNVKGKAVKKGGKKVIMAFNRGVGSTFIGYAPSLKKFIREYENPDPTGDIPVHYLYYYQDFINPYGIGICKLGGGQQNVIDFYTRADVLATQIGIRAPIEFRGDTSETDFDSYVYTQDAIWIAGKAITERRDLANGIYAAIPTRMQMAKGSLNNLIPLGDTSVSAEAGDPMQSKTPAGVKFQQAKLSADDDDMKDNLFETYRMVCRSMINTRFAYKTGKDIMLLTEVERERIFKSAPDLFPQFQEQVDEMGNVLPPSDELEVIWDNARANFDFTVDPEPEKIKDEEAQLEGMLRTYELVQADPTAVQEMQLAGKKFNKGELLSDIIQLQTDNDKIVTDISPEEMQEAEAQQQMEMQQGAEMPLEQQEPQMQQPMQAPMAPEAPQQPQLLQPEEIMQQYQVDQEQAMMLAELQTKYPLDQLVQQMRSQNV